MRSRKKRMEDIRAAKDQKMKKVAIGLAVVFVAVLAYEVLPHLMHKGGSSAAAAPPATTTSTPAPTTGTPAPATTPPGTAAAAVTPTATSTKLTNSDQTPHVGKAQLYSFSQFSGRDPFAQQLTAATAVQPNASGQAAKSKPTQTGSSGATSATGTTASVTNHQPTRTLAVAGAARIAVNGQVQVVRVGASFPSANPLFRLLSVTNGVAKIGIATGSYSSGAKSVTLRTGQPLTLVDTADGIRYQIRLVS
jgi:hypothetical protein